MINSKVVLTATTVLGIFGLGWLIVPDMLGRYWAMAPGDNLNYMGHRYGALLIGLALTTALSLYGAVALGLNAWVASAVEFVLTAGLAWVLFVKPEPVV